MSGRNIRKGKKTRWARWQAEIRLAVARPGCSMDALLAVKNWGRSQLPDKQSRLHRGMDAPTEAPAAEWSSALLVACVSGDHCRDGGAGPLAECGCFSGLAWRLAGCHCTCRPRPRLVEEDASTALAWKTWNLHFATRFTTQSRRGLFTR